MDKTSRDIIILNLCNKKPQKTRSYDVCLLRYGVLVQTKFFVISDHFCFFTTLLTLKLKIWKKCKKPPDHIILLCMCTINQDHMIYGSWGIKFNRQFFFVILDNFLPFYLPNTLKNEKVENEKNPWRYHHFTKVYKKS